MMASTATPKDQDPTAQAHQIGNEGVVLLEAGKFEEAYQCFKEVLDIAEEQGNTELKIDALGNIGLIMASTGDPVGGLEKFQEALALAKKANELDPEPSMAPMGHFILADVFNRMGRTQDAEREVAIARRLQNNR